MVYLYNCELFLNKVPVLKLRRVHVGQIHMYCTMQQLYTELTMICGDPKTVLQGTLHILDWGKPSCNVWEGKVEVTILDEFSRKGIGGAKKREGKKNEEIGAFSS